MRLVQAIADIVYPPQCLTCQELVESQQALCPKCWFGMQFICAPFCPICGVALPGDEADGAICDDCTRTPRPWSKGRAVFTYAGKGRDMVLAFKHGDRLDMTPALGQWMGERLRDFVTGDCVLVPVPLHWRRKATRKYNQAEVLATRIATLTGTKTLPHALRRVRRTQPMEHHSFADRVAEVAGAFALDPRAVNAVQGQVVVLVDDVMTSGATLTGCAEVLQTAGPKDIHVLTLARVGKFY